MGIYFAIMKKLNLLYFGLMMLVMLTAGESCRKPKDPVKPKDPCANKKLVSALDAGYYYWGHFEITDQNNDNYWLHAVNWSSYSAQVIPGRQYRIAYTEVPCSEDRDYTNNKAGRNPLYGGCFARPLKCIRITCLEDVKPCTLPRSCLFSEVNPLTFGDELSYAQKGLLISGDEMKVKIGFSGCDRSQINNFKLLLQETRLRCPDPKIDRVFLAKAITNNDMICQAYFEEDVCFDLSALRTYMMNEQFDMSKPVVIRLMYNNDTDQDFIYKP